MTVPAGVSALPLLLHALLLQPRAIGDQSALRPGGPLSAEIGGLWNMMLWVGGVCTVLTFIALGYALFRRRSGDPPPEADRPADPRGETSNDESGGRGLEDVGRPPSERKGVRAMVGAGIIAPTIILGFVLVATLRSLAAITAPPDPGAATDTPPAPGVVAIEIWGRQYWWRVRYLDATPSEVFETANEVRIPVGVPVQLRLRSDDVIHSFWVPGLGGKMDLIPGRTNVMTLHASRPGTWRGQCAEFCGLQHGKMAIVVVAEPAERFAAWQREQRAGAPAIADTDSAAAGDRDVFLASGCVLCHAVRGTPAGGRLGPDLTHVAGRRTLAAGTLPNNIGNMYGWIADPQAHKPGSQMPAIPMTSQELHAIARYLSTLK